MNPALLKEFLSQKLPEGLKLLQRMVEINSYTFNREGVNQLARFTAEAFESLGFEAEFVEARERAYGTHLVLTRRGKGQKNIAMVSHLDTVFPPEEELRNNFRWQVEGDRIYGPGTQDIKGGTIMIWLVLSALEACAPTIFEEVTWKLFLNAAEEQFSPDFGELCRQRMDKQTLAALVFEAEGRLGTESLVVVARKGRASWRATVEGRAAHAGSKHRQGANAIVQMGRLTERIAKLTDYSREVTVNVGTIRGGTVLNRVPHETVAEGEMRAFDPKIYAEAKADLMALTGPGDVKSTLDGYTCQVKMEILTETRPWPQNEGSQRLFECWRRAGAEAGLPIGAQERGGLSDGNLIWDVVPTLDGLGPWGDNDHCSERSADGAKLPEYVEISSFVPKAVVNVLAISELAGD